MRNVLAEIVEQYERHEEADELLNDVHRDLNESGKLRMTTRIRLDNYLGYDDSE